MEISCLNSNKLKNIVLKWKCQVLIGVIKGKHLVIEVI